MLDKKKRYCSIIALLVIVIAIYFMYIYYYYNEITLLSFIKHTVGSINLLSNDLKYVRDTILSYKEVLIMLIIMMFLIISIDGDEIKRIFDKITNLEIGGFKVGLVALNKNHVEEKISESKSETDDKIKTNDIIKKSDCDKINPKILHNKLTSNNIKNDRLKEDKKLEDILFETSRVKVMELLVHNPEIVEIIEKFMKNSRNVIIPLKLIHTRYKIDTIDKLFNWEKRANSIKINSIKEDMSTALLDVYTEFKEKNIIYSTI